MALGRGIDLEFIADVLRFRALLRLIEEEVAEFDERCPEGHLRWLNDDGTRTCNHPTCEHGRRRRRPRKANRG